MKKINRLSPACSGRANATGEVTLESLTLSGYEYRKNHEPR